jgi:hypothetical protein
MNRILARFLAVLKANHLQRGYGFIEFQTNESPTFDNSDCMLDATITGMIEERLEDVNLNIISFDDFIVQSLGNGIVSRTIGLDRDADKCLLVINGFCDSVIFDKEYLMSIPSQKSIGFSSNAEGPQLELMQKLDNFAGVLDSNTFGFSLPQKLEWLNTFGLTNEESKYLLNWYYVYADRSYWQSLWYQDKVIGMPLLLVVPHEYHDAVVRYNQMVGGDTNDFRNRATIANAYLPLNPELFDPEDQSYIQFEGTDNNFELFRSHIGPLVDMVLTSQS